MKKHIHCDLIIAWANGEKIQCKDVVSNAWFDTVHPSWDPNVQYKVKPREFEPGAYYAARYASGFTTVIYCMRPNLFKTFADKREYVASDFSEIGRKLYHSDDLIN